MITLRFRDLLAATLIATLLVGAPLLWVGGMLGIDGAAYEAACSVPVIAAWAVSWAALARR